MSTRLFRVRFGLIKRCIQLLLSYDVKSCTFSGTSFGIIQNHCGYYVCNSIIRTCAAGSRDGWSSKSSVCLFETGEHKQRVANPSKTITCFMFLKQKKERSVVSLCTHPKSEKSLLEYFLIIKH